MDRSTAQRAIDSKTKPLGALGQLEEIAVRLSVAQNTLSPGIRRARVCVFAADHGVTDEGVSAYPRAVTAEMMKNFAHGGAAINVIARTSSIEVEVIDVGVDADLLALPTVRHAKVRRGSRNLAKEAAMSDDDIRAAMTVGAKVAFDAATDGVAAIGFGEMGIGNTTASAALLSALTGRGPDVTVGRGTGIDDAVLAHKRAVVAHALEKHGGASPEESLRRLGGLEIAAIAGAALECVKHNLVIVVDGFISTVAVLAAIRVANTAERARLGDVLFFSHRSAEPGHALALDACNRQLGLTLTPIFDLGMRLGEGTGAALAIPVLRSAAAIMREMATFESAGVSTGDRAEQHAHDG